MFVADQGLAFPEKNVGDSWDNNGYKK